ncbi:hypothetical protein V8E36_004321 [Tilletia maclaganii]
MSFQPLYTYTDASSLAQSIQAGDVSNKKIAIVDVRDDDFEGGAITGARNVPSTQFHDSVQALVKDLVDVPKVIFHCHLSQQRGPKAARIYAEARKAAIESGSITPKTAGADSADASASDSQQQSIVVLRDGAAGFIRQFKDDKTLVQNYDAEAWAYRE